MRNNIGRMIAIGCGLAWAAALHATPADVASAAKPSDAPLPFTPPPESALPQGPFGAAVKRGEQIFLHTPQLAGAYVGNALNCASCHLDAGRMPDSSPMWGAYTRYPAFRSKTGHVDRFAERLQGCFQYSMNGKAPPLDSEILIDLEAYSYWLASGAPIGAKLRGAGYPRLPKPKLASDYMRGAVVYAQHCAICHGADGAGQSRGNQPVFPALWGPKSFNWGAGMHAVNTAAGFIEANMPLGLPHSLTTQQAWDVAMFMDSHERPQDPRFDGNVASTRAKYHDSPYSMYGMTVNGQVLGASR